MKTRRRLSNLGSLEFGALTLSTRFNYGLNLLSGAIWMARARAMIFEMNVLVYLFLYMHVCVRIYIYIHAQYVYLEALEMKHVLHCGPFLVFVVMLLPSEVISWFVSRYACGNLCIIKQTYKHR